jgi:hypothetical protein
MLIISMPIALWNLLPDDPAYSFVGFVNSSNLAPQSAAGGERLKVTDVPRAESQFRNQRDEKPTIERSSLPGKSPEKIDAWVGKGNSVANSRFHSTCVRRGK